MKKISFCISTNGARAFKTEKAIAGIIETMLGVDDIDFEIIIAGQTKPFKDLVHVKLIAAADEALDGKLALLRNKCGSAATGDVLVFMDDDIIFAKDWCHKLEQYSWQHAWHILGNKILLPNGDRYWDRALINPHQMVPYDFDGDDPRLYQTGCFWVIKAEVFKQHKWNESIVYYAEKNGGVNEDVEYSQRLVKAGYKLMFDPANTVWHWDDTYRQLELDSGAIECVKVDVIPLVLRKEYCYTEEFIALLNSLETFIGINVGLLIIATGKYEKFVQPLLNSARKYFLPGYRVTYFLFSDSDKWKGEEDVVNTYLAHEPFPGPTLNRYRTFHNNRLLFDKMDYLFYCDADALFAGTVTDYIFSDRVAVIHPAFLAGRGTPETRPESLACIHPQENLVYVSGAFNGGTKEEFLKLAERLYQNIEKDLANNIIAIWHDESHLNRYFVDNPPTKILSPSYCYPESWSLQFEKKILVLDKNNVEIRGN